MVRISLNRRSRSATTSATPRSMCDTYLSAVIPATCFNASRWYGNATTSRSSIIHVGPIRYPRRAAAMDHVLEKVRLTATRESSFTSGRALCGENCAYASSTTTTPGAVATVLAMSAGSSARPVGLLGEQRKVTLGWWSVSTRRTSSSLRVKSALRLPFTTVEPAIRAMCECS